MAQLDAQSAALYTGAVTTRLEGRRGIVTGGARGIGLGIAERLSDDGAQVVSFDLEDPGPGRNGSVLDRLVDISDRAAVKAAVAEAETALDGLDFLVNNAGIRHLVSVLETTEEQWRSTLDVNLTGAFFCTQAVLPSMLAAGDGRIVNISSIAGMFSTSNRAAYCASKAGIEGLTRAVAVELGHAGIRANAIAPNAIETDMTRHYFEDPALTAKLTSQTPTETWGQPSDVAGLVAFLLTADARFVNGATLYVDGGWTAGKDTER